MSVEQKIRLDPSVVKQLMAEETGIEMEVSAKRAEQVEKNAQPKKPAPHPEGMGFMI